MTLCFTSQDVNKQLADLTVLRALVELCPEGGAGGKIRASVKSKLTSSGEQELDLSRRC